MPGITNGQAMNNPVLTQFAQGYVPANFVNRQIMPPVVVSRSSGKFYEGKNPLFVYDTERALRTQPKQVDFFYGSDEYHTQEHALDVPLDEEEIREAEDTGVAALYDLKNKATSLGLNLLELKREKAVLDTVFGTANFDAAFQKDLTDGSNAPWNDYSDGDPIGDIMAAVEAVRLSGAKANGLVLDRKTWQYLRFHPDLSGQFKNQMGPLTLEQIIMALGGVIDKVIVVDSLVNTGTHEVEALSELVSCKAAVIPIPTIQEMQMGARVHSALFDMVKKTKVMEWAEGKLWHLQAFVQYGIELINNKAGYLFTNTYE